jgi:hypothetical protein
MKCTPVQFSAGTPAYVHKIQSLEGLSLDIESKRTDEKCKGCCQQEQSVEHHGDGIGR